MASRGSRIEGDMDELFARSCALSPPTSSKKLHSGKLWQGHYCCVPLCRHSSAKNALRVHFGLPRLSFHSFPSIVKDKARAQQWISKIRQARFCYQYEHKSVFRAFHCTLLQWKRS